MNGRKSIERLASLVWAAGLLAAAQLELAWTQNDGRVEKTLHIAGL